MRTITEAQQAVLDSLNGAEFVRVSIKDSGGTFRDLTTYPGFNAVKSVTWSETVTDPHMVCEVVLLREFYNLSLSPYKTTSALNKGFNPAGAFAALIAQNREVKVEVAIVPQDKQPASGDWMEVFRGRVDDVDTASGWDVKISCRSLGGRLAQQFIKTELVYSHAEVTGIAKSLRVWEPQIAVVLNVTYLLPASRSAAAGTTPADSGNNKFFKCSQSGTTGTAEPTWTTGVNIVDNTARWDYVGATTTAGNPVEEIMQNILDDHKSSGDASVTLYVPASPGWAIRQYLQAREYVLNALLSLANQIGWDLRYKWRVSTAQFELTFYVPTRTAPSVLRTFAVTEFENPTRLAVSISNIRNSWRIIYSDASDLWPDNTPKRKVIEVSDATSITKYGELWSEIQEDENSQIDSSTEATTLVNAALSDCKEPNAELSIPLTRGFPWVEINDYYTFTANNLHFDSNQSLAVTGWSHSFEPGLGIKTQLDVRGLPTVGAERWLVVAEHPYNTGRKEPAQIVPWSGFGTPGAQSLKVPGGVGISISNSDTSKIRGVSEYEIHVSTTTGFTPSSTTLQGVVKDKITTINNLRTGTVHYGKLVPRSRDGKGKITRGQPATQFSFTPSRVDSGLLDRLATTDSIPNSDFESVYDADPENSLTPPDHWSLSAGTFGPTSDAKITTASPYGQIVQLRQTGTNAIMLGEIYRLRLGAVALSLAARVRLTGTQLATRTLQIHVDYYDDPTGVAAAIGSVDVEVPFNFVAANVWGLYQTTIAVTAGAAYARVSFYKTAVSSAYGWDVGQIEIGESPTALLATFSRMRAKTATAGSYASTATIIFGTEDYDTQSEYDTATGIFTCLVAGYYQVSAYIFGANLSYDLGNSVTSVIKKNNVNYAFGYRAFAPSTASWYLNSGVQSTVYLAAGDNLRIAVSHDRAAGNYSLFTDSVGNYFTVDRIS